MYPTSAVPIIVRIVVAAVVVVSAGWQSAAWCQTERPLVTQHDVIPILLLRCAACHGRQNQEAGLDVRTKASMLRGGKSGPAFVSGKPQESLILKRVLAEEMPPRKRLIEVSVKTMRSDEIEVLKAWIETGAPEVIEDPEPADEDLLISDDDRQFWAFQPPHSSPIPSVRHPDLVRTPIDAFILEKLEENGLSLSPEADRRTAIRRASFDLTGLPPEPREIDRFLADTTPSAYERMIDSLLASRRYGERWGGYWLDMAGYADTEGERLPDLNRPHAFRYRDYVIRAFNADKPYDRFLLEQISGDELADYESAEEITAEIYDNLVATGFLRMVPDPTFANVTGFVPNRLEVVADALDVLSSAVLGLTVKCARCHAHKFDPIPQRDYYSLAAIFKGAYDEHDWMKPNSQDPVDAVPGKHLVRYLPHVTTEELRGWQAREGELDKEIASLRKALEAKAAPLKEKYVEARLAELPDTLQGDVRQALDTPADERNEIQSYLVEKLGKGLAASAENLKEFDEVFKKTVAVADMKIQALEKKRRPKPMIRALWDRGDPSPTYLLRRGDYLAAGPLVKPAVLSVLADGELELKRPWPGAKKTGRRLALAKSLTRPDHPLTARVIVNAIWKHHFRHGIVKSLGNFGRTGTPPSHPELLDWLARRFVESGWSIKALHRLIMTSATFRQSSTATPEHERLDLDNDLLSRYPLKRMEAEVLWDTLLLVSGRLDETPFGPANGVSVRADGLVTAVGTEKGWRRSIYVEHNRKQNMTILESFDLPRLTPNCLERKLSTVAPQALHLLNNETVYKLAASFAQRVLQDAGTDPARQIDRAYRIAFGRPPTTKEAQLALETLGTFREERQKSESRPDVKALADLCHIVINAAEFIYID